MACPNCGCKETYTCGEDDILGLPDDQERCAACGHIFFFEDHADEDDDGFDCCFPDQCCMPGLHLRSECHTAADVEAQYEKTPNAGNHRPPIGGPVD